MSSFITQYFPGQFTRPYASFGLLIAYLVITDRDRRLARCCKFHDMASSRREVHYGFYTVPNNSPMETICSRFRALICAICHLVGLHVGSGKSPLGRSVEGKV